MSYLEDTKKLAREILQLSRRRISGESGLLLSALYAMDDVEREDGVGTEEPLSTDGAHIYYTAEKVVEDFREGSDSVARQLIHIVSHCLLGHLPAREEERNKELFDGVADFQVNHFASTLCPQLLCSDEDCDVGWAPISVICRREERREERIDWEMDKEYHYMDDHDLWAVPPQRQREGLVMPMPCNWGEMMEKMRQQCQARDPRSSKPGGREAGDTVGSMIQKIFQQRETAVSYQEILHELLTVTEQERVDVQSIDPVWYHLGVEMLEGVPMIEPLESGETRAVMDLVVAIDTSGSCEGDICRRFIQELAGLMRDVEQEGVRYRLLLLQCDTEIQQEVLVESQEDVERLGEVFEPRGFGGTDFEPVFEQIAHRQEDGTLGQVKGLVYFSDGWGDFPQEAPDYPTIFVLYDSGGYPNSRLPAWVRAVELNETELAG